MGLAMNGYEWMDKRYTYYSILFQNIQHASMAQILPDLVWLERLDQCNHKTAPSRHTQMVVTLRWFQEG